MPDVPEIRLIDKTNTGTALEHIRNVCVLLWDCRLVLLATVAFCVTMLAPQTAEFIDNMLWICGSRPAACAAGGGIRASSAQFLVFVALSFGFSVLAWRFALEARASNLLLRRNKWGRLLLSWLPRALGAMCLVTVCWSVLGNSGYPESAAWISGILLLLVAMGYVTGFHGEAGMQEPRYLRIGALLVIIALCGLRPFPPRQEAWNMLLPWVLCGAVCGYELFVSRRGYWMKFGLFFAAVLVSAGFVSSVVAVAASRAPGQYFTWTTSVVLLMPVVYGLLVAASANPSRDLKAWQFPPEWNVFLHRLAPGRTVASTLTTITLVVVMIGFAGIAAANPVKVAQWLFAPSAVVLFIAMCLSIATLVVACVPRAVRWVTLAVFIGFVCLRGVPLAPLEKPEIAIGAEPCSEARFVCDTRQSVAKLWTQWNARHPAAPDAPVLVVAAAGGGARAAAHTSAVLAAVDAATCGAFGDRVFAISGVSGGAVGAALYAAGRTDLASRRDWADCKQRKPAERSLPLIDPLMRVSADDHISAALIRTLFRDLPASLWPGSRGARDPALADADTRAGTLEQAWGASYSKLLATMRLQTANNRLTGAERPGTDGAQPLLLFNATSVQDGRRVMQSNVPFCPHDSWCARAGGSWLGMALDSARFPLISPARARNVFGYDASLKTAIVTERSVVDGGYYDNSGVSSLLEVIDGLVAAGVERRRIVAIVITSNPGEGADHDMAADYSDGGLVAQLLTPAQTAIHARDSRSEVALSDLQHRLEPCNVIHWPLTRKSLNPLTAETLAALHEEPEVEAAKVLHEQAADSLERQPSLGWALSMRSAEQLQRFAIQRALPFQYGNFAFSNERALAARLGVYRPEGSKSKVDPLACSMAE
ncbi:MAG: patatin-like phospholipase family protein [Massilia sp.]